MLKRVNGLTEIVCVFGKVNQKIYEAITNFIDSFKSDYATLTYDNFTLTNLISLGGYDNIANIWVKNKKKIYDNYIQNYKSDDSIINKFICELISSSHIKVSWGNKNYTVIKIDYNDSVVVKGYIQHNPTIKERWDTLKKQIIEAIKTIFLTIENVTFEKSKDAKEQYIRSYNIYNRVELKF